MTGRSSTVPTAMRCAVCGSGERIGLLDGLLRSCIDCRFTRTKAELAPPEVLYHSGYFEGEGYEDYYQPAARAYEFRNGWLSTSDQPLSANTVLRFSSSRNQGLGDALPAGTVRVPGGDLTQHLEQVDLHGPTRATLGAAAMGAGDAVDRDAGGLLRDAGPS